MRIKNITKEEKEQILKACKTTKNANEKIRYQA